LKSESEKRLAGTDRADRRNETKKRRDALYPLPYLNERAKVIFKYLKDHVHKTEDAYEADRFLLSMAAFWLEQFETQAKKISDPDFNPVQTFKGGSRQIAPEISIARDAQKQCFAMFDQLGIGFKARQAMIAFKDGASGGKDSILEVLKAG
jgi:phage terminase small subunit